jgi:hypothetical protein
MTPTTEAPVSINVLKPFILTQQDGVRVPFKQGVQLVSPEVASHWYVQAHLVPPVVAAAEPAQPADLAGRISLLEAQLALLSEQKTSLEAAQAEAVKNTALKAEADSAIVARAEKLAAEAAAAAKGKVATK